MPVVMAAPLVPVFVAVAVLLVAWAITVLLVKPLTMLLSKLPIIGGAVAGAVGGAVGGVVKWAEDWAKGAVKPLLELIAVPINAVVNFINMVGSFADTASHAIQNVWSAASGAVGQVAERLTSLVKQVGSLAATLAAAVANIGTLFARVAAIIATTIPGAIAAVKAWAKALVESALDALEHVLRAAIDAIRPWALAAIAVALKPIQAAIDAIRPWVMAAVAVAVAPLSAGLEVLGQAFGQAIGQILARLSILEKLLPLLALIPLVGAIPIAIETFWRTKQQCTDPTCSLLGNLLDGLGAAGELLTGSVLIYLVTESIHDPEGTAQEVQGWTDELRGGASIITQIVAGRSI